MAAESPSTQAVFMPTKPNVAGPGVVAFVKDSATARMLEQALSAPAVALGLHSGDITDCLAARPPAVAPDVLIVDIGDTVQPETPFAALRCLYPPETRIVVLGDNRDIDFYHFVVGELGAAEYIAKPVSVAKIERFVLPLLKLHPTVHACPALGRIIAVCGLRGGSGAKSIATSLAYEIKAAGIGRVALVDLDIQAGEIAPMLGVHPAGTMRDGLGGGGSVDAAFVEAASIALEPGLSLFAPPTDWDSTATVDETALGSFLDVLRQSYDCIVVLVPTPLPASLARVFSDARRIVAVLMPDAASLRVAHNIRGRILAASGAERMVMVVNRFNVDGHIEADVIAESLGAIPIVNIPDLGGIMLEAINLGVPPVRYAPAIRKYFAPLVRQVTEPG